MKRLLILLLLLTSPAMAADHYINAAVSGGSDDGSDWTNAWETLPATLTRGDTYWIADGTYAAYTFNDAASAGKKIYIRHANADSCSGVAGWAAGFGDGTATFGTLTFTTANWVFDGISRGADWKTDYGFKVDANESPAVKGIIVSADSVTVQYTEIEGNGPDDLGDPSNDGIYAVGANKALTFRYMYIHDIGKAPFSMSGIDNSLVEYCMVARNESYTDQHSEGVILYDNDGECDNNIFRYNIWEDIEGTGVIVVGNGEGCEFYGNLIYWTAAYPNEGQAGSYIGNGAITSWETQTHSNCKYYNNTIIIPPTGGWNFACTNRGAGTGNVAYNNLYLCNGTIGSRINYDDGTTHDYNAYSGGNSEGEDHEQTGIDTTYVTDFSGYDFTLAKDTSEGTVLISPYDVDMNGDAYSTAGGWSIGYDAASGAGAVSVYLDPEAEVNGTGTLADPYNVATDAVDAMNAGDTLVLMSTLTGALPAIDTDSSTVRSATGEANVITGKLPWRRFSHSSAVSTTDSTEIGATGDDSFITERVDNYTSWSTGATRIEMELSAGVYSLRPILRFPAVAVAQGATVDSAWVKTRAISLTGSINWTTNAWDGDDFAAPTDTTTAKAVVAALTTANNTGTLASASAGDINTFNVTAGVNEVFAREGWATGQDIGIVMTATNNRQYRFAPYDSSKAVLYITQTTGVTLPANVYAKAVLDTTWITRMWNDATLMTQLADGAVVDTNNEWCFSADSDSMYVYLADEGDLDQIYADLMGPLITVEADNVTIAKLVIKHSNSSGVRVTGANALIANCLLDSLPVGGSAVGDSSRWVNNVFRAVSDTALAVYGAGVTEETNAVVSGSSDDGLTSPAAIASYDLDDPPIALDGAGTDVGYGNDIGPVELDALIVDTATFRRGYGVGRWGDALQKRWGGSPW